MSSSSGELETDLDHDGVRGGRARWSQGKAVVGEAPVARPAIATVGGILHGDPQAGRPDS